MRLLMLGLLYLIGGVSLGVCLARAITDDLGRVDVLARGIVVGMMTAAIVTYLFARLQGQITWGVLTSATLVLWGATALLLFSGLGNRNQRGLWFRREDLGL